MGLNKIQQSTFDTITNKEDGIFFITGGAGVGKSYLVDALVNHFRENNKTVGITAPTGISAMNINGKTIHSYFGLPFGNALTMKKIKMNIKYKDYLASVDVIVIDEISMVSRYQLDMILEILKYAQDFNKPFGGVKVIMVGDFMQLPPIIKKWVSNKHYGKPYAFYSTVWQDEEVETFYLTEKVRQEQTDPLANALDLIREGKENEARDALSCRALEAPKECTKLYVKNVNVDAENRSRLKSLSTPLHEFEVRTNLDEEAKARFIKSSLVEETLQLKEGAEVIFIKNSKDGSWVNGTRGKIEEIGKVSIMVKTEKGMMFVEREEFIIQEDDEDEEERVKPSLKQFPLKLAYALTIHKSQGMTIDSDLSIDLEGAFVEGLGYVGLSRATKLENLYIKGLNSKKALAINSIALAVEKKITKVQKND